MSADELAQKALKSLNDGDPREARKLLMEALEASPNRPDLINALGVVQLQLGEPEQGKQLIQEAIRVAQDEYLRSPDRREQLEAMLEAFRLALAGACEDTDEPSEAEAAYRQVLQANEGQPRARSGLAHLLFACGRHQDGLAELRAYIEEDRDENMFIDAEQDFLADVERFLHADIHPREFIVAHREVYVDEFNHHAAEQEAKGWIAEAARMKRDANGNVVPLIAEGARPYAAVRVDLVNPRTSEVGQIGDQPLIIALADYQTLARAATLFAWRDLGYDVRVSSQCPWDQLPIHVLFRRAEGVEALDAVIGNWYLEGWNGAWGTKDGGRFHYISDPDIKRDGRGVTYYLDGGRAAVNAIDDLLRRLLVLHAQHPIEQVIIGRGHLPG